KVGFQHSPQVQGKAINWGGNDDPYAFSAAAKYVLSEIIEGPTEALPSHLQLSDSLKGMAANCGEMTLDEILAAADCQRDEWFPDRDLGRELTSARVSSLTSSCRKAYILASGTFPIGGSRHAETIRCVHCSFDLPSGRHLTPTVQELEP